MGRSQDTAPIPREVVPVARRARLSPARVLAEFRGLLRDGAELSCAGSAARRPARLLEWGYRPRYRLDLFGTRFYLSAVRQNQDVRFSVGYVQARASRGARAKLFARLFYKDVSLIWRVASHYVRTERENWIGKGDVRLVRIDGESFEVSDESTTDLPLEVQDAFERISAAATRIPVDTRAIERVLRRAPEDRFVAYRDFTEPRRRAQADPRNRINGGRPVARFQRPGDPGSLRFTPGFEPDFRGGVLERSRSRSSLYGGAIRRTRILSRNRQIQYLFMAGPRHVWIVPPQATTTELSSYGVRTVDVAADDDLCVPGWEYAGGEEVGLAGLDQIPTGYAGAPNPRDPSRSDASPWLEQLPVIRDFRREVLGERSPRGRSKRSG